MGGGARGGVHRGGLHGGGCKGGHMGEDAVHGGGLCTGGPPGSECIGGTHTHMAAHGAAGMTEPPPDHPPPPTQTGTGRRRVKGARSPRPRPLRWEAEPKMAVAAAAAAMFSSAEVQALRNSFVTALGREDGAEEGPRDPGPPLRHSRAAPRPSQHPTYGRPPPPHNTTSAPTSGQSLEGLQGVSAQQLRVLQRCAHRRCGPQAGGRGGGQAGALPAQRHRGGRRAVVSAELQICGGQKAVGTNLGAQRAPPPPLSYPPPPTAHCPSANPQSPDAPPRLPPSSHPGVPTP